jgi:hypothetical protein
VPWHSRSASLDVAVKLGERVQHEHKTETDKSKENPHLSCRFLSDRSTHSLQGGIALDDQRNDGSWKLKES